MDLNVVPDCIRTVVRFFEIDYYNVCNGQLVITTPFGIQEYVVVALTSLIGVCLLGLAAYMVVGTYISSENR